MDNSDAEFDPSLKPTSHMPLILIIIIISLTAVAIFLVPDDEAELAKKQASKSLLDNRVKPPSLKNGATGFGSEPRHGVIPTIQVEGVHARAFIAQLRARTGEPDLEAAYQEGLQLERQQMFSDAYLLFFFAARNGHGEAAMLLGNLSDPAHQTPQQALFNRGDLAQAHKWYQAAAAAGVKQANERLANLRRRIEQDAAAGNPWARRLVLQWK